MLCMKKKMTSKPTTCDKCGSTKGHTRTYTDNKRDEIYCFWACHDCGYVTD